MALEPRTLAGIADPYPDLALARRDYPISQSSAGIWSITTLADCTYVLRNAEIFSSDLSANNSTVDQGSSTSSSNSARRAFVIGACDPPEHGRLRSAIAKAFTPGTINRMQGRVQVLTEAIVDEFAATGHVDLIEDFGSRIPIIVIAEQLGIETERYQDLARWSGATTQLGHLEELRDEALGQRVSLPPLRAVFPTVGHMPTPYESAWMAAAQATSEATAYFTAAFQERRAAPRDDLISILAQLSASDRAFLTEAEAKFLCFNLAIAGHETTASLLGNAVLTLLRFPSTRRQLEDCPELVPQALQEILRFAPSIQAVFRRARRDTEIGGELIRTGEIVCVWLASANRDQLLTPDPDQFDIFRKPNRHLSFGHGPHRCIGMNLTRLMGITMLEVVLRRLRQFRRLDDVEIDWIPSFFSHGVRHLPLAFEPAPEPLNGK